MDLPQSLDAVRDDIVQRLTEAAEDRQSLFHTPVIATADGDARVMVLRAFDRAVMEVQFHTDARAPKVAALATDPRVTMLGYDREANIQLRVRGHGRVERDTVDADAAWEQSDNFARRCYLAPYPPGTPIYSPSTNLPDDVEGKRPSDERLAAGKARDHFAIIKIRIDEVDWFYLSPEGHRRARWRRDGEMSWIAP